ncbi:MAG TPA: hypothetical protein VJU85_06085 [Nitrososphaeraceae archaeon]|nr:hypothetical protein [Nitrososphaeraceae archaeon]
MESELQTHKQSEIAKVTSVFGDVDTIKRHEIEKLRKEYKQLDTFKVKANDVQKLELKEKRMSILHRLYEVIKARNEEPDIVRAEVKESTIFQEIKGEFRDMKQGLIEEINEIVPSRFRIGEAPSPEGIIEEYGKVYDEEETIKTVIFYMNDLHNHKYRDVRITISE